jgi:uncharacterized membrane protein
MRGMLLGAGAMYLLDPDRGARRRSLLRDQLVHAGRKVGDGMSATARDTKNRTLGAVAELKSRLHEDVVDDTVLHERVRSAIGRAVSHPSAISVTAFDGQVVLSGQVLENELDALIRQVRQVRGVREVRNELDMHRTAEGVSSLQGEGRRPGQDSTTQSWAPAVRLAAGTLGSLLAVKGLRGTRVGGGALAGSGIGLMTWAIRKGPMTGRRTGGEVVEVQKTIRVNAPLEQVWEVWSNFEQFPQFMAHVREVRRTYKNRSHWVAAGPAGVPVEWDAVVTEWVPNERIAWKSVEGSVVETGGSVSFTPMPEGDIQIDVRMSYTPPAGALGHAVAALFGADPKRAMDEDMVRLKSLLEEGKTTAQGERVALEDVLPESAVSRRGP